MTQAPQKEIWVYCDLRNERLFEYSLNVLTKARELSLNVSGKVALVFMGSSAETKGGSPVAYPDSVSVNEAAEKGIAHGADLIYFLDHKNLVIPRADTYAYTLSGAVSERGPWLVMFALTDFGRELAARTARIENAGLISECLDIQIQGDSIVAKCPSWAGEIMAEIAFTDATSTGFLTVQPNAFKATEGRGDPGVIDRIQIDHLEIPHQLKFIETTVDLESGQGLDDANIVVVGGAGLGSADDFGMVRELAAALGGEVGATRPPVLQHWVDEDRLIGQTGKTVRPNLLLSIGTSGAVQYTAGIGEAKKIVAINRDERAPIFQFADLGIVTDAKTFLPAFTERVKQVTMRKLTDAMYGFQKAEAKEGFGEKIRGIRESHEWSIEHLAEVTGQSPEFIEKVERDEVTPPVSFLLRLSGALKVDPGTFLKREEQTLIRNMRAQAFTKRTKDYSYQVLSHGSEKDQLMAFMINIEPKQSHKPVAYKHEGEEFIFVMEGDLKFTLGNKDHHLRPGESIHFNSDIPHKLKSTSDEPTRCLVVLYAP